MDAALINSGTRALLVATVMATLLVGAVNLTLGFYYFIFQKHKFKIKIVNTKILVAIFAVLVVNVILVIFMWLYGFGNIDNNPTQNGLIGFIVANFVIVLAIAIYIICFLHYIAAGIDQREISFLGERILLRNVIDFKKDDQKHLFILKYREGRRQDKTIKFRQTSILGQFFAQNVDLIMEYNYRVAQEANADNDTGDDTKKVSSSPAKKTAKPPVKSK